MGRRERGLYEVLVTETLHAELRDLGIHLETHRTDLRAAEAADRIALHLGRESSSAPSLRVAGDERVAVGVALARRLVDGSTRRSAAPTCGCGAPDRTGGACCAPSSGRPAGRQRRGRFPEPLIPLLDTTLLTNAPASRGSGSQLLTEIHSADRIDVVMAFIRRSGIAPLLDALRATAEAGASCASSPRRTPARPRRAALDALRGLGAEVRVSYDTSTTRLHAKAWLFHRRSGFSTAYIGSSNLTHSAQVSGLEWNVRVSGARNPDVVDKVAAVFESYWNSGDFVPYDREEFVARTRLSARGPEHVRAAESDRAAPRAVPGAAARADRAVARARAPPQPARLGDRHRQDGDGGGRLRAPARERCRGRACSSSRTARRSSTQSLATFRHVLRDHAFGELWVGGRAPAAVRARLRVDPEPQRRGARPTSTRTTSTS